MNARPIRMPMIPPTMYIAFLPSALSRRASRAGELLDSVADQIDRQELAERSGDDQDEVARRAGPSDDDKHDQQSGEEEAADDQSDADVAVRFSGCFGHALDPPVAWTERRQGATLRRRRPAEIRRGSAAVQCRQRRGACSSGQLPARFTVRPP